MLLVAGLAIGCSSAPEAPAAPAAPAAPVPNLTEKEAIAIARSSERDTGGCFQTEAPENTVSGSAPNESYMKFTDFSHSESASFKPSGIWVVTAKTYFKGESGKLWPAIRPTPGKTEIVEDTWVHNPECTIVVDDVTGTVKR